MENTKLVNVEEIALKYGVGEYYKSIEYDTDIIDNFPLNKDHINVIEYFKYKGFDTEKEIELYDILHRLCKRAEENSERKG